MELLLFKELLIVLSFSIAVLLIGYRLNIPPVVGFLLTGLLAGPHGLNLVKEGDDIEHLAEIGLLLLLFGIGMEFSVKKFVEVKRFFFLGGLLQVGSTIVLSGLMVKVVGYSWEQSLFVGCLLSMSSTAIVLGILNQKGELPTPHGQLAISILIFQDMIAIPMILLIPLLGHNPHGPEMDFFLFWSLMKGLFILCAVFISAQRFVPRLLLLVARTRNKELFLLSVLTLCFGVAWMTSHLGLSLTIGAFLAGLILSESEYSHEAIHHVFPFQALFVSFFFISIGMLLDIDLLFTQFWMVLGSVLVILTLKIVTGAATVLILGLPIRTAILVGISLSQIGEFSFVLAKTGIFYEIDSQDHYEFFLVVALMTLMISPVLIAFSPQLIRWIYRLPLPEKLRSGFQDQKSHVPHSLEHHVIIVGFGISGRNLARSCQLVGIPYTILEMNPDTVQAQRLLGEPIHFGDATHLSILEHVNIKNATVIAILVNDPHAAEQIIRVARQVNSSIFIIVRARYVKEIAELNGLGADVIIPDEFGTSIEVFSRVLRQYHVPDQEVHALIANLRADGYDMLCNTHSFPNKLSEIKLNLSQMEIGTFRLYANSPLIGKRLSESELRQRYGMTVLLIRREKELLPNPSPDTQLMVDDILVVVGEKMSLKYNEELFGLLYA